MQWPVNLSALKGLKMFTPQSKISCKEKMGNVSTLIKELYCKRDARVQKDSRWLFHVFPILLWISLLLLLFLPQLQQSPFHSLISAHPVVVHPSLQKLAGETAFCWYQLSTNLVRSTSHSQEI